MSGIKKIFIAIITISSFIFISGLNNCALKTLGGFKDPTTASDCYSDVSLLKMSCCYLKSENAMMKQTSCIALPTDSLIGKDLKTYAQTFLSNVYGTISEIDCGPLPSGTTPKNYNDCGTVTIAPTKPEDCNNDNKRSGSTCCFLKMGQAGTLSVSICRLFDDYKLVGKNESSLKSLSNSGDPLTVSEFKCASNGIKIGTDGNFVRTNNDTSNSSYFKFSYFVVFIIAFLY